MAKNIDFDNREKLLTDLASELRSTQTCYVEHAKNLGYKDQKKSYITYNSVVDKNKVNQHKWWSHIEVRVKPNHVQGPFSFMCALAFDEKCQLIEKYTMFFFRYKNVDPRLLAFVQSKKSKYFSDLNENQDIDLDLKVKDRFDMDQKHYGFYKVENISKIDLDTYKADVLKFVVNSGNEMMKEIDEYISSLT
jgi:hypothetical protein